MPNSTIQKKNAFYAQSGGVTAVINATACGLIEAARKNSDKIGNVYAGRNGILGALREELIDTSKESHDAIASLRYTPSGAFGSCRYKLKNFEDSKAEYERLIEVFKAHNIGYFFIMAVVILLILVLKCLKYHNRWVSQFRPYIYQKLSIMICHLLIIVPVLALLPNILLYLPKRPV